MSQDPEAFRTPSVNSLVQTIRKRLWIVVLVTVLCAATAFAVSYMQPSRYRASARLMYVQPTDIADPTGSSSSVDTDTLQYQLQSVIDTVPDPKVALRVKKSVGTVPSDVDITAGIYTPPASSGTGTSNLVEITATANTPQDAARFANAYAAAIIALRKAFEQGNYRAAQQVIENQLKLFTTSQQRLTSDYAILVQQLHNLQIAEASATGDFRVVVPAEQPDSRTSPQPVRSAALGLGIGLIAGLGLAFLIGRLDTRVASHREASEIMALPVVGRVPKISRQALRQSGLVVVTEPDGHVSEALRTLRQNLDWASIDDQIRSVLITSCIKGEGKTLTLCNLAVTLAKSGKRVLVVDADLRHPQVHRFFDLPNALGLTSVVLGKVGLTEALLRYQPSEPSSATEPRGGSQPPGSPPAPGDGSLLVLPAGPLPPDPGEVVASHRFATTLSEARSLSPDYLLIDTPPILTFADAGTISGYVDGMILAVNIETVRRPALVDAREIIGTYPCRKLGIVVVGEPAEHQDYYRYAKGGSAAAERGR